MKTLKYNPNPIMVKELRSRMRGWRAFAMLTIYLIFLALFSYGVYRLILVSPPYTSGMPLSPFIGQALYAAAVAAGVDFRLDLAARRVSARLDRFEQLELADGSAVPADAVIIAAGAWSGQILGLPLRLPVTPVRGQMLAVEHASRLVPHIIKSERCYLVPRGEHRTLVGATVERAGFDESVTESGINGLLMAAYELEPRIAEARMVEKWAGLRPGTPDDLPILGEDQHIAARQAGQARELQMQIGHHRDFHARRMRHRPSPALRPPAPHGLSTF